MCVQHLDLTRLYNTYLCQGHVRVGHVDVYDIYTFTYICKWVATRFEDSCIADLCFDTNTYGTGTINLAT